MMTQKAEDKQLNVERDDLLENQAIKKLRCFSFLALC